MRGVESPLRKTGSKTGPGEFGFALAVRLSVVHSSGDIHSNGGELCAGPRRVSVGIANPADSFSGCIRFVY